MIPKSNEEYISVTYGGFRITDSYRFLSSSLDSLVKAFVDNSHKTLKSTKKENIGDDRLDIVDELEILITEEKFNNDSIEDFKKKFPR